MSESSPEVLTPVPVLDWIAELVKNHTFGSPNTNYGTANRNFFVKLSEPVVVVVKERLEPITFEKGAEVTVFASPAIRQPADKRVAMLTQVVEGARRGRTTQIVIRGNGSASITLL